MNSYTGNTFLKENSFDGMKKSFLNVRTKILIIVYTSWTAVSIRLVVLHPHKYASHFADLPDNLKNVSPVILSLAYLLLFIPAIAVTIIFASSFLLDVIKKCAVK